MRRLLTLLSVCVLSVPVFAQGLFISEYIEGSSNNKAIEIYNGSGAAVDLAAEGYNIQMYFNGAVSGGLNIALTGTVAAGDVYVVAHSSANATIQAQADKTNGSGWFNGDDAVLLRKGTTVIDVVGRVGNDPGTEWGSGLTSTADNTLRRKSSVTTGDANGSDAFDPATEWDGFATDTFDGLGAHGAPAPPPPPPPVVVREIFEIQGSGNASPDAGDVVRTLDNVVTAVGPDGFFLQTPDYRADASTATSNGIYVFTNSTPTVAVGDQVDVEGKVVEFFNFTEFTTPVTVTKDASNVPLPAYFEMPVRYSDFEPLEGMLVRVTGGRATSGTDQFGETTIVAGTERPFRTPGVNGGHYPNIFDVDPTELGGAAPFIVGGADIVVAEGGLAYDFGNYSIWATHLEYVNPSYPRPARARNAGEMTVAAQNMLRLFDDRNDPAIGEPVTGTATYQARLVQISAHIRDNLGSPDVLAVSEVENLVTLDDLAARLNADDPSLSYTAYLLEGHDIGGIDVGFLVRDTVAVDSVEQIGPNDTWENPTSGESELLNDRPALLLRGAYVNNGAAFDIAVVAVHQRSLIDVETSARVRAKREAQAITLADHLANLQASNPGLRLVVTGDFNAFEFSDGYVDVMGILTSGAGLTNQVLSVDAEDRYSYVHDGVAQVLDHSLTSAALNPSVRDLDFAHVNADAPVGFDAGSDHDGVVLFVMTDHDGDGYADDNDSCATGDASATVVLGGCDSGVTNVIFEGGCSLADHIAALRASAKNHGAFAAAVASLLNQLVADGTLTGAEKGALQSCAARWK